MSARSLITVTALTFTTLWTGCRADDLVRLPYNNPGLTVDLGVGLWALPIPMDFDGDGVLDLVVVCPDKPHNGVWFFKNTSAKGEKHPLFAPAKRISNAVNNVTVSYVDGKPVIMTPGKVYDDFRNSGLDKPRKLNVGTKIHPNKIRADQWKMVDYDGDGKRDLVVGVGDWSNYGWDNAYDPNGRWMNDKIHGYVYWLKNLGTDDVPNYEKPKRIDGGSIPIDTFGSPSPNFADFDGDGDLDLICGEFVDGFTYYENIGTRTQPRYAAPRRIKHEGKFLTMDLEMIIPVAIDWDGDGDLDLIVGDEDGRVALLENTGKMVDGAPDFLPPVYFQQQAENVKFGALCTPVSVDWDGDGDEDIIIGDSAGYVAFIENLSGAGVEQPKWAAPKKLEADGQVIRLMAGPNGSIQGPAESKWGYTTVSVADWDGDGLPDLILNSIWGKVVWYKNIGSRKAPKLAAAQPIEVEWNGKAPELAWGWMKPEGKALLTQWRTTPVVIDFDKDGLPDLVMLDQEGYLALFKRSAERKLLPPQRMLCDEKGEPLQFNKGPGGKSGRRKLCIVDWDGDGQLDILINSNNAEFWKQVGQHDGKWLFKNMGNLSETNLAGHDTSPTTVGWAKDGVRDLVIGAEDGYLYYKKNERKAK